MELCVPVSYHSRCRSHFHKKLVNHMNRMCSLEKQKKKRKFMISEKSTAFKNSLTTTFD
jgi:hypothetical protein